MRPDLFKALAANVVAYAACLVISWVALTALCSFATWQWLPITGTSWGRLSFGIAALWWLKHVVFDPPFSRKDFW